MPLGRKTKHFYDSVLISLTYIVKKEQVQTRTLLKAASFFLEKDAILPRGRTRQALKEWGRGGAAQSLRGKEGSELGRCCLSVEAGGGHFTQRLVTQKKGGEELSGHSPSSLSTQANTPWGGGDRQERRPVGTQRVSETKRKVTLPTGGRREP